MDESNRSRLMSAGLLLAAGWIVFWCGAINPLAYQLWGVGASPTEFLATVAARPLGWRAIAAAFALGSVLTVTGFIVLGCVLRERGERLWSELGQVAFSVGLVLWLTSLSFRTTVTPSAAASVEAGGPPGWYAPLWSWAGALFSVYMVLAYLATASYGRALWAVGLMPRWARVLTAFGVLAAVGFVARVPSFNPPLMVHPVPGILGVYLVVQAWRLRRVRAEST